MCKKIAQVKIIKKRLEKSQHILDGELLVLSYFFSFFYYAQKCVDHYAAGKILKNPDDRGRSQDFISVRATYSRKKNQQRGVRRKKNPTLIVVAYN